MIKKFINKHQTIASVLTIIVSMGIIVGWTTNDIRAEIKEIRADTRETNKRIDALYHYVLTKQSMEQSVGKN